MNESDRVVSVGTLDALRATISFLHSVIRCGEPMSPEVQDAVTNAHVRIDKAIAGPTAPKQSGWFG